LRPLVRSHMRWRAPSPPPSASSVAVDNGSPVPGVLRRGRHPTTSHTPSVKQHRCSGHRRTARPKITMRSSGKAAGCTCILVSDETTRRADNQLMLAPQCELYVVAKRTKVTGKADQAVGVAARLLPVGRVPAAEGPSAEVFALVMAHETPGDSRVRALPSPYRARALVSPGVSCRRARSHAGSGASTRTGAGLWTTLGTSRALLLTAAGTAVDNWVEGWGRLLEREIPLPSATCSDGLGGPVDRKKLRTGCRHPVRYSGR
jgi:hypothetical protein